MNFETLAHEAYEIMDTVRVSGLRSTHGLEVAEGFFNIYNDYTGQSSTVLYHPESGMVFKSSYVGVQPPNASRRNLGTVTMMDKTFTVRLPEYYFFEMDNSRAVVVQEYVHGEACGCRTLGLCAHGAAMKTVTNCDDCHVGNWKIVNDEIVLFDFEGIRLDDED